MCITLVRVNYLIPGLSFGKKYCLIIESFVQRNFISNNKKKNFSVFFNIFCLIAEKKKQSSTVNNIHISFYRSIKKKKSTEEKNTQPID